MNRVALVGEVTRNPTDRVTALGQRVARFIMVVDRVQIRQEGLPHVRVAVNAYLDLAEYALDQVYLGRVVSLEGELTERMIGPEVAHLEIVAHTLICVDDPRLKLFTT